MNKSKLIKALISTALVLTLAVLFTLSAVAAPTVKITYNCGDSVYNEFVEAGKVFTPMTPSVDQGDIFCGWVDGDGNLYSANKTATINSDTTLFLVSGKAVSSEQELIEAISQGKTYIRLAKSFTVREQLSFDSGIFVIDTNGYTLTLNTEGDGILGADTGLIFIGSGEIVHNNKNATQGIVSNSLIKLSPRTSFDNLVVNIAKETTITTNMDFVSVDTNIDSYDGAFKSSIEGTLSCNRLMRTNGISGATVSTYFSAKVTVGGEFFFEDLSETKAQRLASIHIYGGTFYLSGLNGVAKNADKYQCAISGGTFSEDITHCFKDNNYSFIYVETTGFYRFNSCTHSGPVVSGMPDSCTEAATLTYQCSYCNAEYSKSFPNGIGHTNITSIEQPLVTTQELTQVGIYKHYCQKCGQAEYEKFYPRPTEVWVTVIVLDLKGREQTLRIPADELYTFDATATTQANSFSTEYVQFKYNITQENIISVEVPLGTTDIHGGFSHDSAVGLFCENPHLREVVLPESLVNVSKYAFYDMPELTHIKGIEYITGTIGEYAFAQKHTNVFIDQMAVNAKTISRYAFCNFRMNSLFIGANVGNIAEAAFMLDSSATPVKEVIVEGYSSSATVGVQVSYVFSNLVKKSYSATNQQFGNRGIVYSDHQCTVTVHKPTCYEIGYTHYECKNCDYEKIEDEKSTLRHSFQNTHIAPTCLTQGYTVDKCVNCGDEIASTKVVSEKRDPNAHDFTYSKGYLYISQNGMLSENGSVCLDKHCYVGKCKCGMLNRDEVTSGSAHVITPVGSHDFDLENKTIVKEPNCGEYGIARFACKVCSATIEGQIPKTGENHKWDAGTITVVPTCTESGIQVFKCTVCDSASGTKKVVVKADKSNHLWDSGVVEREPTEMVSGVKRITCKRCSYSFTEGISKLTPEEGLPVWAIILISVGGVLLLGGVLLTLYFTFFKKKRASDSYKYKFNTLS